MKPLGTLHPRFLCSKGNILCAKQTAKMEPLKILLHWILEDFAKLSTPMVYSLAWLIHTVIRTYTPSILCTAIHIVLHTTIPTCMILYNMIGM